MADIKKLSKCFQEVKRLTGDLISDEQINEILDEAKIAVNESKFDKAQIKTDKILAKNVIDKIEYAQAVKKRNLAENNMKAIDIYQQIIDAVDLSAASNVKFKLSPSEGVLAKLVGNQKFSNIARDSIGSRQTALEEMQINNFFRQINEISPTAWDSLTSGKMDLEIEDEMRGLISGNAEAAQIAKVLKNIQSDLRGQLNDLGANIGLIDDWITRMSHNTEKMARAANGSKIIGDHRVAWREYIKPRLDLKRSFVNVNDPKEIDKILDSIFDSFMSGDHTKHDGAGSVFGTKNVTNRLNASRVLHFKNSKSRQEYSVKFGEPSLKENVLGVITTSTRNIALMQTLGTNPKDTLEKVLALLRKKYKNTDPKEINKLNFKNFENEFKEIDGSINGISNDLLAKVGMIVRSTGAMARLGMTPITSFGDIPQYMGTSNFQGRGLLSGLFEALTGLFNANDRAAMEVLQVVSNSYSATAYRGNVYAAGNDSWGKMGELQNTFFKWNSLNGWVSRLKSSMILGLSRHYGMLSETKLKDLDIRERNFLNLYGIDEGKWDMLRSIKTLAVDDKRYLTAEGVNELSDAVIIKYVGRDLSKREIRNFKKDLELTWRNVLVDQGMHGSPEPDAATRAIMNQGLEKGTPMGETIRFVMQFKGFPISMWKKIIGRELYSYGADEGSLPMLKGLSSLLIMGTIFGYIAMSTKDMIRGRSPRDPKKKGVILQSFAQGGGGGIYGDFLISEIQNEYGNGIFETALGPTAGDIKKFFDMVQSMNDPKKAGKKFYELAEGHTPFLNLYYSKAAYDYLIGYQIKEFLDPGYWERMKSNHKEKRGQKYFMKPGSIIPEFNQ